MYVDTVLMYMHTQTPLVCGPCLKGLTKRDPVEAAEEAEQEPSKDTSRTFFRWVVLPF